MNRHYHNAFQFILAASPKSDGLMTTITLVNKLKAQFNLKLVSDRVSGRPTYFCCFTQECFMLKYS
ncbi:MAG: hypothetical protein K0R59_1239 [Sphingobacterium sp.]|jgi:hypothetical protein|nr:hypothetical protein [Sphingobacterium sp.]